MTENKYNLIATITTTDSNVSGILSQVSEPEETTDGFVHTDVPYSYEIHDPTDDLVPAELLEVSNENDSTTVEWDPRDATRKDISVSIEKGVITEHYTRLEPFLNELARIDGTDWTTAWLNSKSHASWYQRGNTDEDHEAWDAGFPYFSRMNVASRDIDVTDIDRTCYLTISYAPEDAYETSYFRREGEDRFWWRGDNRRPDYHELTALSLYVDIDLADWVKQRPLPPEWKEIVESRLEKWARVYSRLMTGVVDGPIKNDRVFMLDSGGGAYMMTPPAALSPISQEFEAPDAGRIYKEITQRWRMFTGLINHIVCQSDDAPDNLFSADIVQQKNRQYKIGVHKSMDAVVHPITPDSVDYDDLSISEVTDDIVEDMEEWAQRFTSEPNTDHTQAIIEYLFQAPALTKTHDYFTEVETYADPDEPKPKFGFVKGESWKDILQNWLDSEADIRREKQEALEKRRQLIEKGKVKSDVTNDPNVLDAAISQVDLGDILKRISKAWDTDNRSDGTVSFAAPWRQTSGETASQTSTRCMYDPSAGSGGSPIVYDRGDGWARGVLHIVAWDAGIISHPTDSLSGETYWEAVEALRQRVPGIPVLVKEVTDDEDKMSLFDVIRAGRALGEIDSTGDITPPYEGIKLEKSAVDAGKEHPYGYDEETLVAAYESGSDSEVTWNSDLKLKESVFNDNEWYVDFITDEKHDEICDLLSEEGIPTNRDRLTL